MNSNWSYSLETLSSSQNRCVTLKFNRWSWKIIGHLFHATSSFVHHFVTIGEFKLELQSGSAQFGLKSMIFLAVWPCYSTDDLAKNHRAPLLCYFKLCASFCSHWWIETGVTVQKRPILSIIKLCASFHPHMWIQTGVIVQKQLSGVMSSVTLTFNLWPWPFAWMSHLSMVVYAENFRMIRWQEHCQKGVTADRRTDGNKCS